MPITIGPGVTCDIDRLVASRLLIQANSGGGKTRTLRRLLEQTHGKVQHLVIDPEGEYATLRERFDYILAAPSGGDTTAHPRTAALLADKLLQLGVSAILDIYELNPDARQAFVRVFLQALVDAPKALWHPVLVVLDEAHVYAPEGKESASTAAVKALASRGRKRGFCLVPATQRLAKLSKDVAAECNNKLIGRCTLDVDIKRAAEELGFTTNEQRLSLRQLEPGQFYAFGPAFNTTAPRLVLVGPIETSHAEAGQRSAPVPPPTAKVVKLLSQLADLPAEAEAREKTVEDLKRDNAQLRRQLTEAQKAQPKAETKVVEKPALTDGQIGRAEKAVERLASALVVAREHLQEAEQRVHLLADAVKGVRQPAVPPARPPLRPNTDQRTMVVRGGRSWMDDTPTRTEMPSTLTGPEQRILDAIAWLESIGNAEPEQTAVAFLANYTYGAGSFNNPRGSLRQAGHVDYLPGNRIRLTTSGRALARVPAAPLDSEALQAAVLARLPGPEQRLLRPLLAAYPQPLSNEDLAQASNYQAGAGSFNNPKGRLRSLGLIDYPQPGFAVAKSLLFL